MFNLFFLRDQAPESTIWNDWNHPSKILHSVNTGKLKLKSAMFYKLITAWSCGVDVVFYSVLTHQISAEYRQISLCFEFVHAEFPSLEILTRRSTGVKRNA